MFSLNKITFITLLTQIGIGFVFYFLDSGDVRGIGGYPMDVTFVWWVWCMFFWGNIFTVFKAWKTKPGLFPKLTLFTLSIVTVITGVFSLYTLALPIAFQLYYLNHKKNKELVLMPILISISIFMSNYIFELGFQKNINRHEVLLPAQKMNPNDSIFAVQIFKTVLNNDREITNEEKIRFKKLVKKFPSRLKRPNLTESNKLQKAIYSDLVKSYDLGYLFISKERKSLEKPLESKRNNDFILKAISGKAINNNGSSFLMTRNIAVEVLTNLDDNLKKSKVTLDELYLSN